MVSVDIADLESDSKDELVAFIESKLPVKSDKDGDIVTFEDKSPKSHVRGPEVRTYLKRFLHTKDMKKQFRILSEDGSLKFVKRIVDKEEKESEEEEEKGKKE
ncbi:MAG: hypothetical protein OK439_04800 [Thaumarchaeota archaeon]|nr:hypothetical protein [Nitrososphaerota archaeon]